MFTAGAIAVAAVAASLAPRASAAPDAYDPLADATASLGKTANPWAGVPPMCYTKTDGVSNPCWTCHTSVVTPNDLGDWKLQQEYAFGKTALTNAWSNLFADRTKEAAAISDADVLAYVRQDNYAPLVAALAGRADYKGYVPDLDFAKGFDDEGFAKDGSGWRAVRYKPFPGTFWPTNGSADDTMIRLPAAFRVDAKGKPSREIYKLNLAIVEASMCADPYLRDEDLVRDVEAVDEKAAGVDLDHDGSFGRATRVVGMPLRYVGGAADVPARRRLYPAGTEFLHTVRYLDPDLPSLASARMKEVRYAKKLKDLTPQQLVPVYKAAKDDDNPNVEPVPPVYAGSALEGFVNDFGWRYQAYIEDARGRLRLQTHEEHQFCMGCHSDAGVTADQSFAFPRKLPGADGWKPQDLRGMKDVPQVHHAEPEVLTYFRRVQGGDELRGNDELLARFFKDGAVNDAEVLRAAPGGDRDLAWLLAPSRGRAIALDKAYLVTVREQSFVKGRDAAVAPAKNVWPTITEKGTGLDKRGLVYKDGRLHLDWAWKPATR
jgi:hypothetical protein